MVDLKMEMDVSCVDSLSEEQKIAFVKAFSHLAMADGCFDEDEKAFIRHVAAGFGISLTHLEEIFEVNDGEKIIEEVKKINNRRAALELIKEMCILAHADDDLSDEETAFIGRVGLAMGIELDKIEQISNWVIDRLVWLEEAKIIFEEV